MTSLVLYPFQNRGNGQQQVDEQADFVESESDDHEGHEATTLHPAVVQGQPTPQRRYRDLHQNNLNDRPRSDVHLVVQSGRLRVQRQVLCRWNQGESAEVLEPSFLFDYSSI